MGGEGIVLLTVFALTGGVAGVLLFGYGIWLVWLALFRPEEYVLLRRKAPNAGWLVAELRQHQKQQLRRPERSGTGR